MTVSNEKDETNAKWMYNAEALQQELYCLLGDRTFEEYTEDSYEALEMKIAFTKFGFSGKNSLTYDEYQEKNHFSDETSNLISVFSSLYSDKQRQLAKETLRLIQDLIKKENPDFKTIKIAFIFVVFQVGESENCGQIPIIRVLRKEADDPLIRTSMDETWYIDHENRVYNTWQDFLERNRLPKMRICHPKNGYYSVDAFGYAPYVPEFDVEVEFGVTPATSIKNTVFNVLDFTSTGVMLSTLGLSIAAALSAPISGPILATATVSAGAAALYGASRSTMTLLDRKLHFQPITLTDPESRMCWLAIGGAGFAFSASIGSMLLRRAASAGNVVGNTARYTVNGLNVSSLVVNGANVVNQSYHVGEKFIKGQRVSAFDVLNLTMSIFFFGNSLISFKTANKIIQEVQSEVITNTTQQLDTKKSKAGFERLMKNTDGDTPIEKNARVIKTLNEIENPKEFFTKTFKLTKEVNKAGAKIGFGEKGGFAINGAEVVPDQILKMSPSQQQVIISGGSEGAPSTAAVAAPESLLALPAIESVESAAPVVAADSIASSTGSEARPVIAADSLGTTGGSDSHAVIMETDAGTKLLSSSANENLVTSMDTSTVASVESSSGTSALASANLQTSDKALIKDVKQLIHEYLTNEAKRTEMIKNLTKGIGDVQRLELQVWNAFDEIQNKQRLPELLKIAMDISNVMGFKAAQDFLTVCTFISVYVTRYVPKLSNLLNKRSTSEAENQVINELAEENSAQRREITRGLYLEYFKKAHEEVEYHFEDPEAALASYEAYKKRALTIGSFPLPPPMFMEKVQWLFEATEWKKRSTTEDKKHFKILHETEDGWRGVLYENMEKPEEKVVKEFEYVKEPEVKKSSSFFGRLFNN